MNSFERHYWQIIGCLVVFVFVIFGTLGSTNAFSEDLNNDAYVTDNPGGKIEDFTKIIRIYEQNQTLVHIKGDCASACTLFLYLKNICIYPDTRFFFHSAYYEKEIAPGIIKKFPHYQMTLAMYHAYPDWTKKWLNTVWPLSDRLVMMNYYLPFQHIKLCED